MSLYKDLLKKSKEAIADMQVPFRVEKEHKQLEMKIIDLQQQIAQDDLTIQEQKSANPIKWDSLIDAIDRKDLNNRKLGILQKLDIELFSD